MTEDTKSTSRPQHDVLDEELLTVSMYDGSQPRRLTLPDALELLSDGDRISSFVHLQAHQSQAWFCFLCQVAAMALARSGVGTLDNARGRWEEMLLGLSDGAREPWCLLVPDLSAPAFFQPPVPEGEWDALDKVCAQPDDLDLLVTSKNHDVKLARMDRAALDDWIYALVSLQTMANFTGRGNYGVARKSSGYSCRPFVGIAPGLEWGARFRRDVAVLTSNRDQIAEEHGYDAESGLALTWLHTWDGTEALPLGACDPYVLEVCRRVRLEPLGDRLRARRTGTKSRRIDAKELAGNIGDPWTPVRKTDGTALNVSGSGFTYELVSDLLLTAEYEPGVAMRVQPDDPPEIFLVAQALSRGQGQTNGLHERIVPIPRHIRRRLMTSEGPADLGRLAEQRIEFVSTVQKKALRPALCALYQGDPDDLDFQDDRPRPWIRRLDERVDRIFFSRLWEQAELDEDDADIVWVREVLDIASEILEDAIQRASVPEPRRYRGWAAAERIFNGARKRLLGAPPETTEEVVDA